MTHSTDDEKLEKRHAQQKKYRASPKARALRQEADRRRRRTPVGRLKETARIHRYLERRRTRLIGYEPPVGCEICGKEEMLVADHCHKDGHGRGWICHRCNLALGKLDDDISLLQKMIAYLTRHSGHQSPQLSLPGL